MLRLTDLGRMVFVFGLCFWLIGFMHASVVMYIFAVFCCVLLLVSSLYAWFGIRHLHCQRELPGNSVFSGDPLPTKIILSEQLKQMRFLELHDIYVNQNSSIVNKRRLTVLIGDTHNPQVVVAGLPQKSNTAAQKTREIVISDIIHFSQRGFYQLGPFVVINYDPLGFVRAKRTFTDVDEVIVYPHPLPMPELTINGIGHRQSVQVRPVNRAGETAQFHGIRQYVHGDDLRKVHWKSSAHTGKLTIKEFEFHSSGAIQLILDLQQGIYWGTQEHSALEAAITLSASILNFALGTDDQAGLLTTSKKVVSLPLESGQRQWHRVLETLALANDDGNTPLAQALKSGEGIYARRCTNIVITASSDRAMIAPLLALRANTPQLAVILLNSDSYLEASRLANDPSTNRQILQRSFASIWAHFKKYTSTSPAMQNGHAYRELAHALRAAEIEVVQVNANMPLLQVLQAIRTVL